MISCCHLVKKGLKQRCAVFYGEFENEKKKKKKDNICLIFQPEIKLKLASKRDMNLPKLFLPFTVWINDSRDCKKIANSWLSVSRFSKVSLDDN